MKNNPGVKPGLFVDVTWGVGTLSRSVPRPYRNDETIAAAEILPSTKSREPISEVLDWQEDSGWLFLGLNWPSSDRP